MAELVDAYRLGSAEGKPGHKAIADYKLPYWVVHPQLPQPGSVWDWQAVAAKPAATDKAVAAGTEAPPVELVSSPVARSVALLFPGQGSEKVGMLLGCAQRPAVAALLAITERVLGYDLLEVCQDEAALRETRYCQPALFVAGLVALELLREERPEIDDVVGAVAGLSLGEYTALVAAGVLTFEDGLQLVRERAEAMHEAVVARERQARRGNASVGGMVSIAGLSRERVQALCQEAAATEGTSAVLQVANALWPSGFVCAGTQPAVTALRALAEAAGADQVKLLSTVGAFHTELMAAARPRVTAALRAALPNMRPARCAIYMNTLGRSLPAGSTPAQIVEALEPQLTSQVRWGDAMLGLVADGFGSELYELGPSRQLKAIMKRVDLGSWKTMRNVEA